MTRVLCVGSLYKQIKGPASKVDGSQPCSSGWLMGEGWVLIYVILKFGCWFDDMYGHKWNLMIENVVCMLEFDVVLFT